MWHAARAGQWEVATGMFEVLSAPEAHVAALPPSPAVPEEIVPHLARLQPSRLTYAMLVMAASYRGDLVFALTVLQRMLKAGNDPGVEEYVALFRGFARFGVVPRTPAGDATSVFPLWRDIPAEQSGGIANPWGPEEGDAGAERDHGRRSNNTASTSAYAPSVSSMWTQAALEDLFAAFMGLPPTTRQGMPPRAPHRNSVYLTLLAFGRVTNADAAVVRAVLDAMTDKFGPGNSEGWVGWVEDKRITRVRERVGAAPCP
jgi:hypothetical protein